MRTFRARFRLVAGLLSVVVAAGCGTLAGAAKEPRPPTTLDVAMAAGGGAASGPTVADRLVIHTITYVIHTKEPATRAGEARALAGALGGFVLSASESDAERATLVLRVPAARLEEARSRLAALGEVAEEIASGDDVTDTVRDVRIRLENARRTRETYVALLARAASVKETLDVEKELERVTVDIETLEAQLEELETGVRLATITVTLERPIRPGPLGWVFYGGYVAVKWLFVWE